MVFSSLKSRIILSVTGLVLCSIIIVTVFFSQKTKQVVQNNLESTALGLLEATRNHVESEYNSIIFHKSAMLSRRKIELKNNTTIAFSIITNMYQEFKKNKISEDAAKKRALDHLKNLRYDDGVGYFWINNTFRPYPRMIMHPTIPNLDGQILNDPLFNCALGKNVNLFKASVDVCLKKDEGFVDYNWPKPIPEGLTQLQPKISYVKIFKPWGWVIGSGVYIDDIEKDVQDRINAVLIDLNKTILKQRIGESGYFFIFDNKYRMLVHPNLKNTDMTNAINPTTGGKLLAEFKQTALSSEPTMKYLWDKPGFEGEYRFLKKVYITGFKPLGWYIGSSVYVKESEERISIIINAIIAFSIIFIIIALIISFIVSKNIINPLNRLISLIKKTDEFGIPIDDIPEKGPKEIRLLGSSMNSMIAEINKSKNSLFHSEQRFKILSEASQEGVMITKNGRVLDCNNRFLEISGYHPDDVLGEMVLDFISQDHHKLIAKNMAIKFQGTYELKSLHKNGSFVDVEITSRDVDYKGMKCRLSAIRDLSKIKESEKKEKEYQLQLMQADKMVSLGTLVSGVAHEINNPNNAIGFNAPILKDIFDDTWPILEQQYLKSGQFTLGGLEYTQIKESAEDLFDGIIQSSDQIKKIVRDLKNFARPSPVNERVSLNINEVVKSAAKLLDNHIRKSTIHFSINYLEENISLKGNFQRLLQVVINLISNACEALDKKSQYIEVDVKVDKLKNEVLVMVKDQGCGIPEEKISFITDPFFTTKRDSGGTGLGLSVSSGIMKNHGGRIDIRSTVGEGSVFTMVLPIESGTV